MRPRPLSVVPSVRRHPYRFFHLKCPNRTYLRPLSVVPSVRRCPHHLFRLKCPNRTHSKLLLSVAPFVHRRPSRYFRPLRWKMYLRLDPKVLRLRQWRLMPHHLCRSLVLGHLLYFPKFLMIFPYLLAVLPRMSLVAPHCFFHPLRRCWIAAYPAEAVGVPVHVAEEEASALPIKKQ